MMRQKGLILVFFCLFCEAAGLHAQAKLAARKVSPIDVRGVERLIHERNGKILFLNLWATWCKPCVEEFSDIIKLHGAYRDSFVDIAAISVDYPDEVNSKILPLIDSLGVSFTVYVADVKKQEDLINALNPAWSGAVPATFIFDANGKQRAFLVGGRNFAVFRTEIDSVGR